MSRADPAARPARPGRRRAWAVVALVAYGAVVVALTMLKAFYRIGLLWRPEAQRERSLGLIPFAQMWEGPSWFGPLFDVAGNVAFFVPVGVLLVVALHDRRRAHPVRDATLIGAALSLAIEVLQYVFALGHSDVTDLVAYTLGALVGAVIARLCGPRAYPVWIGLALLVAAVFAVLVALGPRLGDPDRVRELGAGAVDGTSGRTWTGSASPVRDPGVQAAVSSAPVGVVS